MSLALSEQDPTSATATSFEAMQETHGIAKQEPVHQLAKQALHRPWYVPATPAPSLQATPQELSLVPWNLCRQQSLFDLGQ